MQFPVFTSYAAVPSEALHENVDFNDVHVSAGAFSNKSVTIVFVLSSIAYNIDAMKPNIASVDNIRLSFGSGFDVKMCANKANSSLARLQNDGIMN